MNLTFVQKLIGALRGWNKRGSLQNYNKAGAAGTCFILHLISHLPAGLGAGKTGFGAVSAMIHFMAIALFSTSFANTFTQITHFRFKTRLSGHIACRKQANIGTQHIQPNTVSHFCNFSLCYTGGSATFTGLHTIEAGANTCFKFGISHCFYFHLRKQYAIISGKIIPHALADFF
jgi:hypothetical protein